MAAIPAASRTPEASHGWAVRLVRLALPCLAALAVSACTGGSAKNRYLFAEKLWTDGKFSAAVGEFEKVVQKDPNGKLGQQALYRAAMTQSLYLRQYDEALRKFRLFSEKTRDPELAWEALRQVGEVLFSKTDQYEAAIQHYRALLKQRPHSAEAPEFQFRIARSQFFLWQFDEALGSYREIEKKYPRTPWAEKAALEQGVTLYTRGEHLPGSKGAATETYQEALDAYSRFLKRYPASSLVPQAQFGMASCLEEMDQLDAAYHQYEALLSTYPSPNVIKIKLTRIKQRQMQRSR